MTQKSVGELLLRDASGEQSVPFSDHNLYVRAVGLFIDAVAGSGQPAATGIDGVKSLAVAEAVKQAAVSGRRVAIDYGGV